MLHFKESLCVCVCVCVCVRACACVCSYIGSRNVFQRLSFNTFKQRKVNGGEKLGEWSMPDGIPYWYP